MWVSHKIFVIQVAEIIKDNKGQIIAEQLEEGLIDQIEYDVIWAEGQVWRNIWELIHKKWSIISRYLTQYFNCPFTIPEQLFQEIIAIRFNGGFDGYSQSHYQQNYKEIWKFSTLRQKRYQGFGCLEELEIKKLDSLTKKYLIRNPWLESVLEILPEIIKETDDSVLKTHLEVHHYWANAIDKLISKGCSDPRNQKLFNTTWIDGCEYQGIKYKTVGGEIRDARGPNKRTN